MVDRGNLELSDDGRWFLIAQKKCFEYSERMKPCLTIVATCCLLLSGCHSAADSTASPQIDNAERKLTVVCTTNIVQDLVRQIGGERVSVQAIMNGSGIDPHTYTPSPRDVNALTSADVVVYSGLHLEGQFDAALESLGHRGIPVIAVTSELTSEPDSLIQTEEGNADPHVWFDPDLWARCGRSLARQLSEIDPDGKETFAANAEAFETLMKETKAAGRKILESVPAEKRVLVTAHDAFAYFARAFDFKVEAVQGISTESEPGLRRINELIELLVVRKISAVFTEQSVSDKNISALIAGCKAKGHVVKVGARLYSDTAGPEGTSEESLSGATLYNLRQIAAALGERSPATADATVDGVK